MIKIKIIHYLFSDIFYFTHHLPFALGGWLSVDQMEPSLRKYLLGRTDFIACYPRRPKRGMPVAPSMTPLSKRGMTVGPSMTPHNERTTCKI